MGHCKSSAKRKDHSNRGLPPETRNKLNKSTNCKHKANRKERNSEREDK